MNISRFLNELKILDFTCTYFQGSEDLNFREEIKNGNSQFVERSTLHLSTFLFAFYLKTFLSEGLDHFLFSTQNHVSWRQLSVIF